MFDPAWLRVDLLVLFLGLDDDPAAPVEDHEACACGSLVERAYQFCHDITFPTVSFEGYLEPRRSYTYIPLCLPVLVHSAMHVALFLQAKLRLQFVGWSHPQPRRSAGRVG